MQRELFPFGILWAETLYSVLNKKLIFDLDDALFINKTNKNAAFKFDKAKRVKKIIRRANLVIAGNSWIRDQSIEIGAKKAIHVDVAEKVQFEDSPRNQTTTLKALWLGSPTTSKYLKFIEEPLHKLQKEIGLEINIVGGDTHLEYAFKANHIGWSLDSEKEYLKSSDIGLMPLPMENWSKGKCGGKARTYMASGLIPIVSNIGYNQDLIAQGVSGFLCNDEKDWFDSIYNLSKDTKKQQEIRAYNFKLVASKFNVKNIANTLEKEILGVAHGK